MAETKTGERRIDNRKDAVEDELTFDAHPHFAAVLLELPGIKTAGRRQTQADAIVTDEVVRRQGRRPPGEIGFRADHGEANVRADPNRDHVSRDLFAKADPGVVSSSYNVGEAVVDEELDLDVRIVGQELRQLRPENRVDGVVSGGDPDGPGGFFAKLARETRSRPGFPRCVARRF